MSDPAVERALDLLRADAVADDALEDAVWLAICGRHGDTQGVVADWYWSRLALWGAMNGGVEQLVGNHHRSLPRMAAACRAVGDDALADLIDAAAERAKAFKLSPTDGYRNYLALKGKMGDLTHRLFALPRGGETLHVDLIRAHRDAFAAALGGLS